MTATANLRRASEDAFASSAATSEASNHRHLSVGGDEAVEMTASTGSMPAQATMPTKPMGLLAGLGLGGVARRTLGICLLLVTVLLWTLSNFLASVSRTSMDSTQNLPTLTTRASSSSFLIIHTTSRSFSFMQTPQSLRFPCCPNS